MLRFRVDKVAAAVVTPMKTDGSIDLARINHYAKILYDRGTRAVYVNGTTGEFPSLTCAERKKIAEQWVAAKTVGLQTVVVHVGSCCLNESMEMARHAKEHGADAIAAVPPYYLQPGSVQDCVKHCADIAQAGGGVPFYYYHIPWLTHCTLPIVELVTAMEATIPTFSGLKFTSTNTQEMEDCGRIGSPRIEVLFGFDTMVHSASSLGFRSGVLLTENLASKEIRAIIDSHTTSDEDTARSNQLYVTEFFEIIRKFSPHGLSIALKTAFQLMGSDYDMGPCRPPLYYLPEDQKRKLENDLKQLGLLNK